MIRAGRGGENLDELLDRGVVGFGDKDLGPISEKVTRDELLARYAKTYPHEKEGSRASWASQLFRFATEVKAGDPVCTYDGERRRYVLGMVKSGYVWSEGPTSKPHVRKVEWTREVPREDLAVATRNTLGAIQTIFKIHADAVKDLEAHARPLGATSTPAKAPPPPTAAKEEVQEQAAIGEETFAKADSFIEDAIDDLDWDEIQHLVAGLLRAMGYRTTVAAPGPDRGVDIFASPDGLGLQEPRIFVEVKHRAAAMGAPDVRSFLGGRRKGDKCLYVSTGGFTKDAYYEADRSEIPLSLVNMQRLRQLVVEHYESLDAETRALIPLRRIYWPVPRI